MSQSSVNVISGDIIRVKADALLTAINSGGMWYGGIDNVINRAAGSLFHSQANKAMPLSDGQVIVARSNGAAHDGAFTNIVFVIDDLQRPLREIIYLALKGASDAGFRSVSLPMIRMGVMIGAVEKTTEETVDEMVKGVKWFFNFRDYDSKIESITFVVYGNEKVRSLLCEALA